MGQVRDVDPHTVKCGAEAVAAELCPGGAQGVPGAGWGRPGPEVVRNRNQQKCTLQCRTYFFVNFST